MIWKPGFGPNQDEMFLGKRVKNTLRGITQRRGSFDAKRTLWDKEYSVGRWSHCENTPSAPVYPVIEKYCRNGSILDLGCGSGNTGNELDPTKYGDYTGVDISEVAANKAIARSKENGRGSKNRYAQADIISCVPDRKHDVILFRESIYYVPKSKIKGVLDRYSDYLLEQGVFIVNVSQHGTRKGKAILDLINTSFDVLESFFPPQTDEFTVVFRKKT